MADIDQIEQAVNDLQKAVNRVAELTGAYGISFNNGELKVQVDDVKALGLDYRVKERGTTDYPVEKVAMIGKVKFFSLANWGEI